MTLFYSLSAFFPMPMKISPVASRIARTVYATQHVYDEELFIMDE